VVVGGLACALATVEAGGPRLVIEVEEPFVLQGQPCPAGTVSIRIHSRYNPATTLHEVCVGGECLGVFLADHFVRDGEGSEDRIRFERNLQGDLVLLGYSLRGSGNTQFFRFSPSSKTPSALIAQAPSASATRPR
jgi:hypothetical protein